MVRRLHGGMIMRAVIVPLAFVWTLWVLFVFWLAGLI